MRITDKLIPGRFLRRENRFRADVEVEGREVPVHVPNPGRMEELFVLGRPVLLVDRAASHRVTDYDLAFVETERGLVSADTRLPVKLFAEAIQRGALQEFAGVLSVQPEVTVGSSRFDFRLDTEAGTELVEVKSVSLRAGDVGETREPGLALFPDAPTARGARHVRELTEHVGTGGRASVVFVVQRADCDAVAPFATADPDFAAALERAAAAGVRVLAYRCRVGRAEVVLGDRIPVRVKGYTGTN